MNIKFTICYSINFSDINLYSIFFSFFLFLGFPPIPTEGEHPAPTPAAPPIKTPEPPPRAHEQKLPPVEPVPTSRPAGTKFPRHRSTFRDN